MAPSDDFTFAAGGDAMIATRITETDHPKFDAVLDLLRGADAASVNLEVLLHDFEGYPAANGPGTYMRAPPWVADELTEMGFDLFAAATNHSMDYTHGGMEATMRELEARNVAYAGLGRNLVQAREPAYVDTASGRVALVAACSTFPTGSEAGQQRPDVQGRPGISPLRYDVRYQVPERHYEALLTISRQLGLEEYKQWLERLGFPLDDPESDVFRFVNLNGDGHPGIEAADEFGIRRVPNREDVTALTKQIERADRQADWVIASLHAHEGEGARTTDETVAPFVESFAHDCIDAGADAFVGHGSHTLRAIEVYDGAPIFYSLGNFVAQNSLIERLPSEMYQRYGFGPDATPPDVFDERSTDEDGNPSSFLSDRGYFESVLPRCRFEDGSLSELQLHPIDLQLENPRPSRGKPHLAEGETPTDILERLRRLSKPYGTSIAIEDETGVVSL